MDGKDCSCREVFNFGFGSEPMVRIDRCEKHRDDEDEKAHTGIGRFRRKFPGR